MQMHVNNKQIIATARPLAHISLVWTQPPLFDGGSIVERWVTAHGVAFEKHIDGYGRVTWYQVVR